MRPFAILACSALLAPLAHGDATAWDCGAALGTGEHEIGDGTAAHTFYVDDRNYALGNGIWIYQESNGIFTPHPPGSTSVPPPTLPWWTWLDEATTATLGDPHQDLQRGGSSPYIPDDNEICVDDPNVPPDTLIF